MEIAHEWVWLTARPESIQSIARYAAAVGGLSGKPSPSSWRPICWGPCPSPRPARGAVSILDTPKSDKMYANYIDRFVMTAAFDEGVGEAELVQ